MILTKLNPRSLVLELWSLKVLHVGHELLLLHLLFLLLLVTLVGVAQDSSLVGVLLLGAISDVNVSVTATARDHIIS